MKYRLIFTVLVLFVLLLGTITAVAQDDTSERTGLRPDAPTYAVRGPYPVGTVDMVLDNEERPLPVTIWYPALNPDGLEEAHTYPVLYPNVYPPLEVYGHALFEAAPDVEHGPYPLVIFSHGFSNFRTANLFFTEHLASHGFVVIAPDHLGMTPDDLIKEPGEIYPMYYNTPADIGLVIDFADEINAEGMLAAMIDTEKVASTGHSSGGFTALQAAGGSLDMNALSDCNIRPDFDCDLVPGHENDIAQLYGLDAVPEDGIIPSVMEKRIDTVIALAPDQKFFGDTGLQGVTIPTLYMIGSKDQAIRNEDSMHGFASLGDENARMIVFAEADHFIFQDDCDAFPAKKEFGFFFSCADAVWDMKRVHDLINHYATAFLLWQLKGDEGAAAVFGNGAETFVGVEVMEK